MTPAIKVIIPKTITATRSGKEQRKITQLVRFVNYRTND